MTLSPQLFAIFANLIEQAAGLHYGPQDRELLGSKLSSHVAEAGDDSLLDFYYRLRYDDPDGVAMRELINALVVHETYFFRELPPLVELVENHLTSVVRTRGRARVWSAACATGEEPLTLAMLLDARGMLDRVEIVATDISEPAIARARSGRHGARSLRENHPPDLARRYLDTTERTVTVARSLVDAVRFETINLVDETAIDRLGVFDVILCRNVLIYFNDKLAARVVDRLSRSLAVDGVLAVGVAESLLRFGTALVCEERAGVFLYRRAA